MSRCSTAQHSRSHLINAIKTNMIEYTYTIYANMYETPTALSENWNAPCLLYCSVSLRTTFLHLIGNFHLWSSSLFLVVNGCLMYASVFHNIYFHSIRSGVRDLAAMFKCCCPNTQTHTHVHIFEFLIKLNFITMNITKFIVKSECQIKCSVSFNSIYPEF